MGWLSRTKRTFSSATKVVSKPVRSAGNAALKQARKASAKAKKAATTAANMATRQAKRAAVRAARIAASEARRAARQATRAARKAANAAAKEAKRTARELAKVASEAKKASAIGVDLIYKAGTMNPMIATSIALGRSIANGDSLLEAAKAAQKAGIKSAKESLQYAQMVAPFVPGIGSGAAAALAAAGALSQGKSITDVMIKAARSAVPGGELACTAFDAGVSLAQGKSVTAVALQAARDQIPGGREGKMAFDAAVALSRGQSLQKIARTTGRQIVSPYAADATEFIRAVKNDSNIQVAALSKKGQAILRRSKRATEIDGRRRMGKRIEDIAQRKGHALKIPKRMMADVKKVVLANQNPDESDVKKVRAGKMRVAKPVKKRVVKRRILRRRKP